MQPLATIATRWIDGSGAFADMEARLGRMGDDVAAYALHTLGWVRIIQISRYSELGFDARTVRDAAVEAAIEIVGRQSRADGHRLLRIEVFDGCEWLHQTGSEAKPLIAFIRHSRAQIAGDGGTAILHQVPYSFDRIWALGDPQVRAVAAAWRAAGGRMTAELDVAIARDCPDRSVKVMVPDGNSFRLDRYRSSRTGPWDRTVWNRFLGHTLHSVVPDPMLSSSVTKSGDLVLRTRTPRLERCRGPVLASAGPRDFAWYRLSLPVWKPGDSSDAAPHGVLTVLSPDWREDEAA